jgi:hypothetical protein
LPPSLTSLNNVLALICVVAASSATMADPQPDAAMLAPIEKIVRFMEAGDESGLSGFADSDVAIIENFAPFVFDGNDAVSRWAAQMRAHLEGVTGLKHTFGPAQNFSVDGERLFLSLPTNWTGVSNGRRFDEDGGWAFVLVKQRGEWRIKNYGWAVTRLSIQ